MGQEKYQPIFSFLESLEPDLDKWTAWHIHFGYNQNLMAYFERQFKTPKLRKEARSIDQLVELSPLDDFNDLTSQQRGLWKHIFDLYDDVEMNCKFLDIVFMDWPLFKFEYDISKNYPTPDVMLYFSDQIDEAINNKGFSSLSRPESKFHETYFTENQDYYIIDEDKSLFSNLKFSRDEY